MKKELIMIFGLFFILVSLGFASAQSCYVTTYNSCIGNNHYVAMRLSADTNAHGEVSTGAYTSVVCCDFGSGGTSCTGNNAILRLSATGNAHAEAPELVTNYYTQFACYDGLVHCRDTTSNCGANETEVVYLSNYTNAHLSASGYSTKICCEVVPPADDCVLTSATWNESEVVEGTPVNMILTGDEFCSGANINFSIYEWDGTYWHSSTGVFPSATWTAERFGGAGDYNERIYYFTGTVIGAGESTATSGNLTVLPNIDCGLYPFCESYDSESLCNADPCISASDPNLCACEWNATSSVCEDVCPVTDPDTGQGIGVCVTPNYEIITDCEEGLGYLTYNWTSTWTWDEDCDAQCRITNADKEAACRSGSKTIECPAQILLPFFGIYSMIISVLAIAMIYVVLGILKKRKIRIRFE